MGALDIFRGGSSGVQDFTEQEPYTELGPSGGRRRRKSLRRKGARKGTRKRARKHYGGYSQKKQQQGGTRLEELEDKVTREKLTADEQSELDGLRKEAAERAAAEKEAAERAAAEKEAAERAAERAADGGGSRRRKSRHSKKSHSKKTRGKKSSPWIKHVLQFAKDHKMKYFQALKDKRCRAAYKSSK
jgi:colicin import membrane protein